MALHGLTLYFSSQAMNANSTTVVMTNLSVLLESAVLAALGKLLYASGMLFSVLSSDPACI